MFESSASHPFESSSPESQQTTMQPTKSVEDKRSGVLAESDAYMHSNSIVNGVIGHSRAVHPTAPNNHSLAEIVSQEFHPFDAETLIIHPIMGEESSDEKFYKELGEHLIESLLSFHAWAAARPRHEHNVVCEMISSKIAKIEETEKDQGRYYTSLCAEDRLRLSSAPSSYHRKHRPSGTEDEERKYPFVEACPHSPPRPVFVCSRSLEQNRRRLAAFVEMMTNAVAGLAKNLGSI